MVFQDFIHSPTCLLVLIHRFAIAVVCHCHINLFSQGRPSSPWVRILGVPVVKKGGIGVNRNDSGKRKALVVCTLVNAIAQVTRAIADLIWTLRGYK